MIVPAMDSISSPCSFHGSQQASVSLGGCLDVDGWEFIEESSVSALHGSVACGTEVKEEMKDQHHQRIFGCVPSRQEAAEVASGLQNAVPLGLFLASEAPQAESLSSSVSSAIQQGNFFVTVIAKDDDTFTTAEQQALSDWIEPQLVFSEPGSFQAERHEIYNAFKLLQNVPDVKEVIASIVSDQAIWDAVVKNEGVQELGRYVQDLEGSSKNDNKPNVIESNFPAYHDSTTHTLDLSSVVFGHGKRAYKHLKDKFVKIAKTVLPLVDTKFLAEKNGDPLDRTVKSCMILAVVVLALILVKRSSSEL